MTSKRKQSLLIGVISCFYTSIEVHAEEKIDSSIVEPEPVISKKENAAGWMHHVLDWELVYTGEMLRNFTGGITQGSAYRGDLSLYMSVNTEAAGWWRNGEFFLHAQQQHGNGITENEVGDFQVLSNIDADDFIQLSEIWYKHSFFNHKLSIKAGKQDANADFAYTEFGGEFINSSPGFSPTIPLVTYPDPGLGVVMEVVLSRHLAIRSGVYQGRPDGGRSIGNTVDGLFGPMLMIEPSFSFAIRDYPGQFRIGYWYNGDTFEHLDGAGESSSASGIYAIWDQLFYRENPALDESDQGAGFFIQFGYTGRKAIEAKTYFGAGFQWAGAIPHRDRDIVGLGLFYVHFNPAAGLEKSFELTIETFYEIQLWHSLYIKPDIQLIMNPGGSDNDTAIVGGIRWGYTF